MKKVLILGSGGLRIGQAGEFDYSGSQAIKALKEEGIETILINPNIATVQTDATMADRVYLQPLNVNTVEQILKKERPDGLLLSFGGQTALNLGLKLDEEGILKKYDVEVLGSSIETIRIAEDRELFKQALTEIGLKTAKSISCTTIEEALAAAEELSYPIMMRSGFSLGGLGSGKMSDPNQLKQRAREALANAPQVLIEEYLSGWKEVEYEIVRDKSGNGITVCNMENFDPMGIHTGESIVIAPSQTLTNQEYYLLRDVALKAAHHLSIIGECNIQYALDPNSCDYRIIELNPRLSRSSALASKATGYPLAFVAAKLAIGQKLSEMQNRVTGKTSAFFEPALDYVVVKMPRWDTHKLRFSERTIGSEMKSVGEVMAIGRSFPEALQKAIRMLGVGHEGLTDHRHEIDVPLREVECATDRRLFAIGDALKTESVETIHKLSKIDLYFLHQLADIVRLHQGLNTEVKTLRKAKRFGFSDKAIARVVNSTAEAIRRRRITNGILPVVKQIDTLAGEFAAETNYLYLTYHGSTHDIEPSKISPIIVLGSGPYCIGSSVEFDWCAVNTARALKERDLPAIIINSNPETVSTDYDESDRLYFEELTLERVQDIADLENPRGLVVSVGGQIANNLALPLQQAGHPILGTAPEQIDQAENRKTFSAMLARLDIDQPAWEEVTTIEKARDFAATVGYPILVRPSYVLSGAAMNVIGSEEELALFLKEAAIVSPDHPVVMSQFITGAKELEIDAVADEGKVVIEAISEHIENAGVHSGDATIVLPPQRLYLETIRRCKEITRQIAEALALSGPFNIQFIAKDNAIKVIECNVRAARSFPFVSKVTGHNFIEIATDVLLGTYIPQHYETLELDYVGVKTPQFSYNRLKGSNPVAHVEMASTGEVACLGDTFLEAFFTSWLATEQNIHSKKILVSIGGDQKLRLLEPIRLLESQGWQIFATDGTQTFLSQQGVGARFVYKASDEIEPNVRTLIEEREVDLILNIPTKRASLQTRTDGYSIRRLAIDHNIPLLTNLQVAQTFLACLTRDHESPRSPKSWQEFLLHKDLVTRT